MTEHWEPHVDLSLLINTTLAQSTPTLAYTWNPVLTNLLVGLFLLISIGMILLVLIQRPQGGGLSGAFGAGGGGGGAGAGQTAFGTKTGDVLTGATITIFVLFLITAIVLNFATRPQVPVSNTPGISSPAAPGTGTMGDPVDEPADEPADEATQEEGTEGTNEATEPQSEPQTDGQIADPAQAIDDAMSSTPSVESDEPQSDTPQSAGDQPGDN